MIMMWGVFPLQEKKKTAGTNLQSIPGIGPNMEQHLRKLGYTSIESLKGQNPEEMYKRECLQEGVQIDRCALYAYRLAVYFAENDHHDPEKLFWWKWKDEEEKKL